MKKELLELREAMQAHGVDVYLIDMGDDHQSEHVGDHYREIRFISGFTGSAGRLVVTRDEAWLWTDGRYFVQAEKELSDTGIGLMRMGKPETPDIFDHIADKLKKGGAVGFNGRTVAYTDYIRLREIACRNGAGLVAEYDLPGLFWKQRPERELEPCFILDERYTGMSASKKLDQLRADMDRLGAEAHIMCTLDDIAWLLNLRGGDIPDTPVFMAFMLVEKDRARLYTDEAHLTDEVREHLKAAGVEVDTCEEDFYSDISELKCSSVLIESAMVNAAVGAALPEGIKVIDRMMPTTLRKCIKNSVERENLKQAHIKDGVAMMRFMHWFLEHVDSGELTEWSCVERLHEFRAQQEGFLEESFTTISAYGENAAMCHYHPSKEHDVPIRPRGLYLVDSGGQYYEGTTDITRTWACGETTREERESYTLSVIANLRLADARFLEGTGGACLDHIAREPFWRRGLNFDHGTGHGVGYMLNVHERPVGIRYKAVPERLDQYPFREGMFVSDEPGVYIAGSHGVRTENLLMCVNDMKNEYGQFCRFEIYTLCPIDKRPLDMSLMEEHDIELLDSYHRMVYERLSPYLSGEELSWLEKMCAPVKNTL